MFFTYKQDPSLSSFAKDLPLVENNSRRTHSTGFATSCCKLLFMPYIDFDVHGPYTVHCLIY